MKTPRMTSLWQRSAALAALLVWLAATAIAAAAPTPADLNPQDRRSLQQIGAYLNSIHTLTATFQQHAGSGVSTGHVWLQRPGKMRFEYDRPNPVSLFADGFYVYYWDKDLHQISKIGLKATPAWFLLRDPVTFDDVIVTGVEHGPNTIRVSVVESAKPDAGSLTMVFTENPLLLRQWTVVDQEGKVTTVSLSDLQSGMAIDPKVFVFEDPYAARER